MAIDELVKAVPPPVGPVGTENILRRIEVERQIGITLPNDFWELGCRYGSGSFAGTFLSVFNPTSDRFVDSVKYNLSILELWRGFGYSVRVKRKLTKMEGYPVFPSVPGLFPWAGDENNGLYCWKVIDGDPDSWPLVIGCHGDAFVEIDCDCTSFLAGFLENKITLPFYKPFEEPSNVFSPSGAVK